MSKKYQVELQRILTQTPHVIVDADSVRDATFKAGKVDHEWRDQHEKIAVTHIQPPQK